MMNKNIVLKYLTAVLLLSLTGCGGGSGNEVVVEVVKVIDVTAPVITLNGDNPIIVNHNSNYSESGALVSDNVDKDLMATITGTVDTSTLGESILSYSAVDGAGNEAVVITRIVNVVANYTHNGPGLGKFSYSAAEEFKRISLINRDNGIPAKVGNVANYGLNLGYMFNGYFVGVFSSDHGWSGGGWLVMDVSEPKNPTMVSRAFDVKYDGSGASNNQLGTNATQIGSNGEHYTGETGDIRELHGAVFWLEGDNYYAAIPSGYGVEIWDFTHVGPNVAPTRISRTEIPNIHAGDYTNTSWQITGQIPYLYVANANRGVTVVDVSNVSQPSVIKNFSTNQLGNFRVGPIFVMGNQMVITSMESNAPVATIDISDPLSPSLQDTYTPPSFYYATCFNGTNVFFAERGGNARTRSVNVSDPNNIMVADNGSLSNPEQLYCATQGDTYITGNQEGIAKYNITNPSKPTLMGKGSLALGSGTDHGQVSFFGNLVYVGNDHGSGNGFIVHDRQADNQAPRVSAVSPIDGATNQHVSSRVGLSFSDNIVVASLNTDTFIVRKQGTTSSVAGVYSAQADIVNFFPDNELEPSTTYEVVIPANGLADWSGNLTDQAFVSSFTTSEISTLTKVTGGTASASSEQVSPAHPAQHSIDDNQTTRWTASNGSMPQFLQVDYGREHRLSAIEILFESAAKYDFTIEVSSDNNSWTQVIDRTNNTSSTQKQTYEFLAMSSRYIRINFIGLPVGHWAAIFELNAYEQQDSNALKVQSLFNSAAEIGNAVAFSANGDGGSGTLQYQWDFGDGSPVTTYSTNSEASHLYVNPGHYPVIVHIKDATAAVASDTLVQTVYVATTAVQPTKSSSIVFDGTNIYAVNSDNDTVTKINGNNNVKSWEVAVGKDPKSIALAPNGDLWVVNKGDASLSVLHPNTGATLANYQLARASQPFGLAFSPDGTAAYVTVQASGELLKLNPLNGDEISRTYVGTDPRGIAVSGDSQSIYVTRFISAQTHAEVSKINAQTLQRAVITLQKDTVTPDAENESKGLPNYLSSIVISPDGKSAWVPSVKTNVDRGTFNSGVALDFESTVRAIISQINLENDSELFAEQLDFDDRTLPADAIFSPLGDYIIVALQGNNKVQIRDAYTKARVLELDTDFAPKGIALNHDGSLLYVHNFLGRSVQVFNLESLLNGSAMQAPLVTTINTVENESLSQSSLNGKQIFYNAGDPRMSRDTYLSCASCHLDGDSDRRVWDFTDRGEGLRNTRSLLGSAGIRDGNLHWTGNFDEVHDFEHDIRNAFQGQGFMTDAQFNTGTRNTPLGDSKTGVSSNLDDLANYVSSLTTTPNSPFRNQDGSMTSSAVLGKSLFTTEGCADCHSGEFFTDGLKHDVATIQASSGLGIGQALAGVGFDTPSLLGSWFKAPYFHNGQVGTLAAVMSDPAKTAHFIAEPTQRDQILAYIQQLEQPSAGLYYGTVEGNINTTTANPKVKITLNLNETEDQIAENTTEIYTGYIYDADGNISFMEYIDDKVQLRIDDVIVLDDDRWNTPTTTDNLHLAPGWHSFELRISNGGGGGGPVSGIGFGFDPNGGTNWIHPADTGTGELFRTVLDLSN
ncbi:MAG: DNA-binding beta-propeller fold protein YncE [Colwellia sp.]|jgi:DNA-binding beta-propeller fold protein YncE